MNLEKEGYLVVGELVKIEGAPVKSYLLLIVNRDRLRRDQLGALLGMGLLGVLMLGAGVAAAFLLGNGIESMLAAEQDAVAHARRVSEARQLLLPEGLGEAFKVMALGRGWDAPLAGFALQDLLSRL
jgi:hypothetical protein